MALLQRKELDELERSINAVFSDFRNKRTGQSSLVAPHFDVCEADDRFYVYVECPGVKKEDLYIELHNGNLLVKGEKRINRKQNHKYHIFERRYGAFERRIKFPTGANSEDVKVNLSDGVLEICIPKKKGELTGTAKVNW